MSSGGTVGGRWWLLVAVCCVAFLALGPVYDTNDDPALVGLLSGAVGGRAFDAAFLGSPLSAALRALYAALPTVPWYGLVIEGCNVLAVVLWAALIVSCPIRPSARLAAIGGLLIGCSYLMLRVNFMAAAFSLFLAATAWLWKLQLERCVVRWRQAWLGAAMGLAYLIRPSLQWLFLFFALPCLAVSAGRRNLQRLLLVAACAGPLILITVAGEHRRHADPKAKDLAGFDRARSLLVDVPRDPTQTALAAAGWSRGDYEMAVRFGMYDEELYSVGRIRRFVAAARRDPWVERSLRTSRTYLFSRFHLLCLAALLCVVWLLRSEGGGAERPRAAIRHLVWVWVGAGTLALVLTRFPPRAFVPLYLFIGALTVMVSPLPAVASRHAGAEHVRTCLTGVVAALLGVALVFWVVDGRRGRTRMQADARELAAGIAAAGPEVILVPVGPTLETQYASVFASAARRAAPNVVPTGWVAATPALDDFLSRTGFTSGRAFMRGLVADRRVVFVVRRSLQHDAQWLVERLNERYAPGERLAIEPVTPADGPGYLFFRISRTPDQPRPGVVQSRG